MRDATPRSRSKNARDEKCVAAPRLKLPTAGAVADVRIFMGKGLKNPCEDDDSVETSGLRYR